MCFSHECHSVVDEASGDERAALIADIKLRTGLEVNRVAVRQIAFLRDAARLTVYHHRR